MLPELGVGVTYSTGLEPLIVGNASLFHVIEVEPQTLWLETREESRPFRVFDETFEKIASLPGKKLVHSIGAPVGGTVPPDKKQFDLLRKIIRLLQAPYASEHLSFNATHGFNTGFFLPPRQTLRGVESAVASIRQLQDAIHVPLAVETGVNYFRLRKDEMQDGEFFATVAEKADCGILLDLHNLFANEINGRQSIEDFLSQIPLERVWEVHLAGGFEMDGYYLDAHSGEMSEALHRISQKVIARLPNLKAVIFEIFPSFLPVTGLDLVRTEVEKLHRLWNARGTAVQNNYQRKKINLSLYDNLDNDYAPADWELAVGSLAVGKSTAISPLAEELAIDPAMPVVQKLINEFRGSMLVSVFPLTSRLIVLTLTEDVFMTIMRDFWSKRTPKQYASSEAEQFADYLVELDLKVPSLMKILEFEKAVMLTLVDDQVRIVEFDFNPFPILESLAEAKLPERQAELGLYEIEVTPQVYADLAETGRLDLKNTFPFH